ncbi:MAG: MlaA family lipoprotein [Geminicoccaceae bacterium]
MSIRIAAVLVLTLSLLGCASTNEPTVPAKRQMSEFKSPPSGHPIDIYDPLEKLNRGTYAFNAVFDEYVFLPLVDAYQFITFDPIEDRISDFFSNLTEISSFANSMLQLNFENAGRAASRFFINSTIGLLGFIDIATLANLPQEREDFGQTLGVWGAGDGPYLVLPILGPSNLRDTTGIVVDALPSALLLPSDVTDDTAYRVAWYGIRPLDVRKNIAFRYYQTGSPFEYELVRLLYTQKRALDIQRSENRALNNRR